jgi:hypothetical protein
MSVSERKRSGWLDANLSATPPPGNGQQGGMAHRRACFPNGFFLLGEMQWAGAMPAALIAVAPKIERHGVEANQLLHKGFPLPRGARQVIAPVIEMGSTSMDNRLRLRRDGAGDRGRGAR